jgi:hypothetical protein
MIDRSIAVASMSLLFCRQKWQQKSLTTLVSHQAASPQLPALVHVKLQPG